MGLFDFWKKKESPKPAPQRRRSYRARAYHQAAAVNRLTNDWKLVEGSADAVAYSDLRALRLRCRALYRDNDYAKRYVNLCKVNVIGHKGIRLQSQAIESAADLGATGAYDDYANRLIESGWKEWGKRGVCTVDGLMSWVDCQELFIGTMPTDGEVIIRMIRNRDVNKFGFALQFYDSDHLDETYNAILPNGNLVRMGIELDVDILVPGVITLRPVAYYLLRKHPGDSFYPDATVTEYGSHERVPAADIIHGYLMERPNQRRGIPWMATGSYRLKMLDGYEEAELVAARTAAAKMGFFTSVDGEGYEGEDTTDEDGNEMISEAEAGTFEQLPAGSSFQPWDPQHPVAAFEPFVHANLRGTASGFNVSYVNLANDLRGVSFSSIRQGELGDRDAWRRLQRLTVEQLCEVVYAGWLDMALMTGAVALPYRKVDKFLSVAWKPRGWSWVSPKDEVDSARSSIEAGLTSPQDVASENGKDLEEIYQNIAAANKLAEKYGISPTFGKPAVAPATPGEAPTPTEGQDDGTA